MQGLDNMFPVTVLQCPEMAGILAVTAGIPAALAIFRDPLTRIWLFPRPTSARGSAAA
jgi:hypothetical protein